jgi:hypothetical protein
MASPRVLVAATSLAMRVIEQALGTGVALLRAQTLEEAVKLVVQGAPQLVIVGYHFEQARALLHHLQERFRVRKPPVILVRVPSPSLLRRGTRATYGPHTSP